MRGTQRKEGYVMDKRHKCILSRVRGTEVLEFIYGG